MTGNSKAGRSAEVGYDEDAALEEVEAFIAEHPGISPRAAIIACLDCASPNFDAVRRRLQRRLAFKNSGAAVRDLLTKTFKVSAPRQTRMWKDRVDVPIDGEENLYGVICHVVVGRPVMMVVLDEEPVRFSELPEHPLFKAIEMLPERHTFDDPDYRLICEVIGIDPDKGRAAYIEAYEDAVALMPLTWSERSREEVVAAGLRLFDGVRFNPGAVRDVMALETDPGRAARILDQSIAALRGADWNKDYLTACLRMLPNPWGFQHESSVWFGIDPDGQNKEGMIDMPLFIEPPHPHHLAGRLLALLHERNSSAVVLSPEEFERWKTGGDHAYWLRVMNSWSSPFDRIRPPECDLSMTVALREAMISAGYDGYMARKNRVPFDPYGPFAYQRDGRSLPASRLGTSPFVSMVAGRLPAFLDRQRRVIGRRETAETCIVEFCGGELVFFFTENGDIEVRNGQYLPCVENRRVDVFVSIDQSGIIPILRIHWNDFRMTFTDDDTCLPKELALPLLGTIEDIAMRLAASKSAREADKHAEPRCDDGGRLAIFDAGWWRGLWASVRRPQNSAQENMSL